MASKILMVTGSHDLTCDYLIKKYPTVRFFRFNLDQFSKYLITVTEAGFTIKNDLEEVTSETCKAIYYRKPLLEDLSGVFDQKYHSFAHKESFSMIEGIVDSFEGICLSKPADLRKANNKVVQLALAKKIGFSIPRSIITNSQGEYAQAKLGTAIVKPLATGIVEHNGVKEFVQTNLVDNAVDDSLMKYAPAYFQEYINKEYELRVTFVGANAHTVRIDSANKIDWRKSGNKITYTRSTLPLEMYKKCRIFMEALNMEFGCFDFMVKADEYYFLEMNANGQWAWLEQHTGIEISKSIIEYLNN